MASLQRSEPIPQESVDSEPDSDQEPFDDLQVVERTSAKTGHNYCSESRPNKKRKRGEQEEEWMKDLRETMKANQQLLADLMQEKPAQSSEREVFINYVSDRPIISGNGCPTERISQFVYHFLKEVAPLGKSFLKDTTTFLQCIRDIDTVDTSCLLVALDVTSLYTNIPNDEGIRAVEIALEEHRPLGTEPLNNSIIDLLRLVLTCNNFTFNGEHYLQVGSTAMGTKAAPNYAVNFMNFFEKPLCWKRYIDDIFML